MRPSISQGTDVTLFRHDVNRFNITYLTLIQDSVTENHSHRLLSDRVIQKIQGGLDFCGTQRMDRLCI